jgi:lipoate-protein ligase B
MKVIDCGRIAYAEAWERQRELVERRAADAVPDTVLLCEHPHVVTLGRGLRVPTETGPDTLPGPDGDPVPVFHIERGGLATYHGPGQLVAYVVSRLDRAVRGLDGFLRALEEAVIRTSDDAGIAACRSPGATGVWVRTEAPPSSGRPEAGLRPPLLKIASIGVAVRRWVTYHGLALNVSTDLRYFRLIRPCGFAPEVMASLSSLRGAPVDFDSAKAVLSRHLLALLAADAPALPDGSVPSAGRD